MSCFSSQLGAHGVRTVDNLRKYCGLTSEAELEVINFSVDSRVILMSTNRKRLHGSKRPS